MLKDISTFSFLLTGGEYLKWICRPYPKPLCWRYGHLCTLIKVATPRNRVATPVGLGMKNLATSFVSKSPDIFSLSPLAQY